MTTSTTAALHEPAIRTIRVALVGNPNAGKSSLFNALTGRRQRIGNYPGVTVEKKTGQVLAAPDGIKIELVDLPGTYSLAPHSADEAILLDVLLGKQQSIGPIDVILNVLDATNLARNLFLHAQLLELGKPVVAALNMMDLADARGLKIDMPALSHELGVAVVPIVATKNHGIDALIRAIVDANADHCGPKCASFPSCVCSELDGLGASVPQENVSADGSVRRLELLQTLLTPGGYHERHLLARCGRSMAEELTERRKRIHESGESVVEVEARIRYAWINRVINKVVQETRKPAASRTDKADRILTHPVWGLVVLLALMTLCFQAIYSWSGPLIDIIDSMFAWCGSLVSGVVPEGAMQSLLVNGVLAGVGAILVFLPQILILYLFIAIIEDCGYMARAAFLFDRWMSLIGLSGRSFIPLLSSFACAVPGIMATRTIENRRDRLVTILIAPLMSCSARLPVYTLMIGAFVPATRLLGGWIGLQAMVMLSMYAVGIIAAVVIAWILQKTIFKGQGQPFLLELPTYKWPTVKTVFFRVYEQGFEFCKTAGSVIFAVTVVVWALGYYPRSNSITAEYEAKRQAVTAKFDATTPTTNGTTPISIDEQKQAELDEIDRAESGAYLRSSFLGRMGLFIEPIVEPLGWDWRIGTAAIASFPAREVVIATMGTIYNLGSDVDEESTALRDQIARATWPDGRPVFNLAVALSLMVFFALCCQCGGTLAVIKRETNSWRWPIITFTYMTLLAYVAALIAYQTAIRLI